MSAIPQPISGIQGYQWTMAAYHATASRSGLTAENALADQSLNILSNQFQIPSAFSNLAAVYAGGAAMKNVRLTGPSLRKYANYYVVPWDAAAVPASPTAFDYLGFYNPMPITSGDLLSAEVDNGGSAEYDNVLIFLSQRGVQPVKGQIFTVRATGATTLTAHAWTAGQVTFDTTLEEGMYAIVGMHAEAAHLIAARIIFIGVANSVRPGCLGYATGATVAPLCFRYGRLGVWGVFDAAVQPQIEYLSTTADTTEAVWLDLIKLSIGSQGMGAAYPNFPITSSAGVSPTPLSLY